MYFLLNIFTSVNVEYKNDVTRAKTRERPDAAAGPRSIAATNRNAQQVVTGCNAAGAQRVTRNHNVSGRQGWWLRCSVLVALIALVSLQPLSGAPLKVCLLSASAEYESEKSLSDFQSYLEGRYQIVCQRVFGKDKGDSLPGLEDISSADLIIVFTRRVTLPTAQLESLQKYIAAGKPIIGLRTASHAFQNYTNFDRDILGGGYKGHYTNSQVAVQISPGRSAHPVLVGVTSFTSRKLYKNPTLADDVVVLLEGATASEREPIAWVHEHNGGRIFYTSLGTQEDFTQDSFKRLLTNAIFWTTRRTEAEYTRPVTTRR